MRRVGRPGGFIMDVTDSVNEVSSTTMNIDVARLTHRGRIRFAVRCARLVRPLFDEAWPEAIASRKEAVDQAIDLAERSAQEGNACDGLKDARIKAVRAAGQAYIFTNPAYPESMRT